MLRTLIAAIFMFLAGAAYAERRVALVIGADDYGSLRKLSNAVSDAQAVGDMLKQLGFKVTLETDRNLKYTRRALEDFSEDNAGADVALVYYAGHGVEIAGDNRLLPVDADASSLDALKGSSLPLEEVRATVAGVSKVGLIILDACRDDPFGIGTASSKPAGSSGKRDAAEGTAAADAGSRSGVALASPEVVKKARPGLGRIGRAEGILFAFSAAPGEKAADGADGHSPFARALVKYLGTDGLEVRSALTLVQQEVYDLSRGKQLPYVESGLPGLFFAATTKEQLPERERLLLAMADITPALRGEVEQIAAEKDMPLAPLYAALIGADIRALSVAERGRKLEEAAQMFVIMRTEAQDQSSKDEEVVRLRQEAERQLSLGLIKSARATLDAAVEIDRNQRKIFEKRTLRDLEEYVEHALSEAATTTRKGDAAAVGLQYRDAIADYEAAASLYDDAIRKNEASSAGFGKAPGISDDDQRRQARVFWSLGDMRIRVGDLGAAREAYGKSRDLLAAPSTGVRDERWQRELALVYSRIGDIEWTAGDAEATMEAYGASLALYERLHERNPADMLIGGNLWIAHSKMGDAWLKMQSLTEAIDAYERALEIVDGFAAREPGKAQWKNAKVFMSERIADARQRYSTPEALIEVYRENLEIRRQLASENPGNAEMQQALSVAYERVSQVLARDQKTAEALDMIEQAVAIRKSLVSQDPQNLWKQQSLAIGYELLGGLQRDVIDLPASLASYEAALALRTKIASVDAGAAAWQDELVATQDRVAEAMITVKDFAGAIEMYQASIDLREKQGQVGRDYDARRDLARRYNAIGDLRAANGAKDRALGDYQQGLSIQREIAGQYPTDANLQRDVATSLTNIAYLLDPSNRQEVIAAFEARHRILQDLAERDPGSAQRQIDLIWSHRELASHDIRPREHLERALSLAEALVNAHRLSDENAYIIDLLKEDLSLLAEQK